MHSIRKVHHGQAFVHGIVVYQIANVCCKIGSNDVNQMRTSRENATWNVFQESHYALRLFGSKHEHTRFIAKTIGKIAKFEVNNVDGRSSFETWQNLHLVVSGVHNLQKFTDGLCTWD